MLSGLIAWLSLSHYIYGSAPLLPPTRMALTTAVLFLILTAGVLCLRKDSGLIGLLLSDSAGGLIARRLVPAVLVFPFVAGWLRVYGQRAGWYETEAGGALVALATPLVFGGLIWRTAVLLERSEADRKLADARTQASRQLLGSVIDSALDGIIVMDHEGRIAEFNPAAQARVTYIQPQVDPATRTLKVRDAARGRLPALLG